MNKGLWIARKNHLFCLIRKVSNGHGGDESEFISQHFCEVLKSYPDDAIEKPITCYEEMVEQLRYYPKK